MISMHSHGVEKAFSGQGENEGHPLFSLTPSLLLP